MIKARGNDPETSVAAVPILPELLSTSSRRSCTSFESGVYAGWCVWFCTPHRPGHRRCPEKAWERRSRGDGAKGPRLYDWAVARLPAIGVFDGDRPTHERWVLDRRSLVRPNEIAYYLAYAPNGTSVADLVHIALALGDRGSLPDRQERMRPRSVRGPSLSGLVPAHHTGHARPRLPGRRRSPDNRKGGRGDDPTSTIRFTVAEIRRLLDTLMPRPTPRLGAVIHALNWSLWRRPHQAIARRRFRRPTTGGGDHDRLHLIDPKIRCRCGGGSPSAMDQPITRGEQMSMTVARNMHDEPTAV